MWRDTSAVTAWPSTPPCAAECASHSSQGEQSGSFIPSAPLQSSVALAPPWPPGSTSPHRSPTPSVPPRTSGSSPSPWLFSSLSPPRALPPWLLPPSALLWAVMALAWVLLGSSCFRSLLSPSWLFPPSFPPWFLPPWSLSAGPLPGVSPPPEPPPKFPPTPPSVVPAV